MEVGWILDAPLSDWSLTSTAVQRYNIGGGVVKLWRLIIVKCNKGSDFFTPPDCVPIAVVYFISGV